MTARTKKYDIGACHVFFKGPGASSEVALGHTSGGVSVKISMETQEIEVDQLLEPVDEIVTKRTITVGVPLVEFTPENLQMAFPGSTLVTDATDPTKKKLLINSVSGQSTRDNAGALRLHPVSADGDSDKSKDFLFPAAAPVTTDLEITYTKDGLKTIPLEFKAYPSEEEETAGLSLIVGDPAATAASGGGA